MDAAGGFGATRLPRLLVVLCAAVAALFAAGVLAATPAAAHAVLLGSDPEDGAELDAAPAEVTLEFNEPVSLPPDAIRVFDATGERVDEGDAGHGLQRSRLRIGLRDGLGDSEAAQ